jgi:hypothetical protein
LQEWTAELISEARGYKEVVSFRIQVERENHSEGTEHLHKIAVVEHTANEDYYQDSSEATGLSG